VVTLEYDIVLDLDGHVHTARHGRLDFDRFQKDILRGTNESPLFPAASLMTGGERLFHGGEHGALDVGIGGWFPLRVVAVEALVEAIL
jgi:hypothetical protein